MTSVTPIIEFSSLKPTGDPAEVAGKTSTTKNKYLKARMEHILLQQSS
jgi:hypothetical protein